MTFYVSLALTCLTSFGVLCGAPAGFVPVAGPRFVQVAVGSKDLVYGRDSANKVHCLKNGTWQQLNGTMQLIAAGENTLVGLGGTTAMGGWEVFTRSGVSAQMPEGDSWDLMKGVRLTQISAASKDIMWGVKGAQTACQWTATGFKDVPGKKVLKMFAGKDGTVLGLEGDDVAGDLNVVRCTSGVWDKGTGAFVHVAIASKDQVWGVTKAKKLLKWNGSAWEPRGDDVAHVAAASDGTVYILAGDQGQGGFEVFKLEKPEPLVAPVQPVPAAPTPTPIMPPLLPLQPTMKAPAVVQQAPLQAPQPTMQSQPVAMPAQLPPAVPVTK